MYHNNEMPEKLTFFCKDNDVGLRLDIFLHDAISKKLQNQLISRNRIKSLIENKNVKKDNAVITTASSKTVNNSFYQITIPPLMPAKPIEENIPLDIIFEDKDIIVINKASGMVVHPGFGNNTKTLVNALLYHCKGSLSGIGGITRPGIVHRIDKDTSGIIVSAKNDLAHINLSKQFKDHSINRSYLALVWGILREKQGTISNKISRHSFNRKKMGVNSHGKIATTHWKVIKTIHNLVSLVKCTLETGRTHQIRVHFSHLGHHLVGDKVYTSPKLKKHYLNKDNQLKFNLLTSFPRQALHAYHLSFLHPRTKQIMKFDTKEPNDLNELLSKIE